MAYQKRKYFNFAAGWLKQKQNGEEYISAAANGKKATVKLLAELEDGTTMPIDNFAVMFNAQDEKKSEKSPDVRFVFSIDEE